MTMETKGGLSDGWSETAFPAHPPFGNLAKRAIEGARAPGRGKSYPDAHPVSLAHMRISLYDPRQQPGAEHGRRL
jgi:hypothetical protein